MELKDCLLNWKEINEVISDFRDEDVIYKVANLIAKTQLNSPKLKTYIEERVKAEMVKVNGH